MKKRILVFLLVLCLTAGMMPVVSAETIASGTCGENVTWVLTDDGILTISGEGAMADYDGLDSRPPYNEYCRLIETVIIENGVTSIGTCAFDECPNLTSVTISDTVTSIGVFAFFDCTKLTSLTIPDSVVSIDDCAFVYCDGLISVTIPASVTSIGMGAFSGCGSLIGIWVDSRNPSYSNDIFGVLFNKNKTELMQAPGTISGSYIIPSGVTSIGDWAFGYCNSLTSVTIPASVMYIHGCA